MIRSLETVPNVWTTADDSFFRVVATTFPQTFLAGAGVLLASYDADIAAGSSPRDVVVAQVKAAEVSARATA